MAQLDNRTGNYAFWEDGKSAPAVLTVSSAFGHLDDALHLRSVHQSLSSSSLSSSQSGAKVEGTTSRGVEEIAWLKWMKKKLGDFKMNSKINLPTFERLLPDQQETYTKRLFSVLDRDGRGYLFVRELLERRHTLKNSCACFKLKTLFDMYDVEGNGALNRSDLSTALTVAADDNGLALKKKQIDALVDTVFDVVDTSGDDQISFEELRDAVDDSPALLEILKQGTSDFLSIPIPVRKTKTKKFHINQTPYHLLLLFIKRQPREFVWTVLYILSLIGFYVYGALYATFTDNPACIRQCRGYFVAAKGFGMNLNWNSMLMVIFMLRRTITWVRSTRLGPYLPLDSAIFAHKTVGQVIGVCIIGHVLFHFLNFNCLSNELNEYSLVEYAFTTRSGLGWIPPGFTMVLGWPLICCFLMQWIFSMPFVRRSGYFEIFFYTHLFYIPYFIILLLHSDKFWKFFVAPGIIFVLEKISSTRLVRRIGGHEYFIRDVILWPSGVTQLTLSRPPNFNYAAGDYVYLNIPDIARFEWHPFSISSSPDNAGEFTLHIRAVGEWTRSVHNYFTGLHDANVDSIHLETPPESVKRYEARRPSAANFLKLQKEALTQNLRRKSIAGQRLQRLHVPVWVDGPYGTVSAKAVKGEHVVLICAGIGATPFASILQNILRQHIAEKVKCPECYHLWAPRHNGGANIHLKKVTFIWLVNNQRITEWLGELLEELDEQQTLADQLNGLIDLQIYVTSAKKMRELYSFALAAALKIYYEKHHRDLITGIKSAGIPGRPNWNKVFGEIERTKMGRVSVFYCGPPPLAKELREKCTEFNFDFYKESFY